MLPAKKSNIFECNVLWNHLGIFAERQIKLENGGPTITQENNILEWIVAKSCFFIFNLSIINGGS